MDTRGGNRWHTTEPWHNSPLPEGVVGALEAPQDKHGQEHRTGTSRAEQTDKGGHGGAGSSGGHGVARGSGGHGSAGSSGGHGRWSLWPWPRSPRPGPYNRNPFTPPPPKISLGKLGVIRSPPGLNRQDKMTGKPSRARQTGQDRTAHRNRKPSWAGLEAEASSGHDRVRGPHRVPQQPLPLRRQGGRRLECPPWPQQEEPPAPDESLWTWPTR